jgi:hypothetical protein
MVFVPEGQPGTKCLCSLDVLESSVRGDLCPEGGYRTQPRVSTLGTLKINEFALKLKGREAEQINFAPMAAQKLECSTALTPTRSTQPDLIEPEHFFGRNLEHDRRGGGRKLPGNWRRGRYQHQIDFADLNYL